ncbi:MAG: SRPBCC family protein [Gemmatimonadaceae bacterium]
MMPRTHSGSTTRSDTRAVTIEAPVDQVFDFIADPANLPRWAVGFCRAIHRDDDKPVDSGRWIVSTARGDVPIRYVTDRTLGVIDFYLSPAPGIDAIAFSRVVPNGDGAEYVFTQFRAPGMSDELFEGQVRALMEELQVLRSLMRARAACPG